FEAFDRQGSLRAICGGGRYDHLLSTFGGKDIPACGFGFGDVVILELLSDKGLIPELEGGVDDVVFAFSEDLRGAALQVASHLREAGRSVDLVLEARKVKWAFRHA
ncbi:MAG TPA: histidine--tRNA ligase, partial [Deltaproteobacteria bacterium]|nr:histidine--tRNA ligase [Deltaproteobacteria bacterium]